MDAEKYNRSISLNCPTCAGDQFEFDGEDAQIFKCASCDREYKKEELINANSENISEHTKEIGKEITDDLLKGFRKSFSKNKNFQFK